MQSILSLRLRATAAKTKKLVKTVRKRIRTKRTPKAADGDIHCSIDVKLDPYMLTAIKENAVQGWIQPVDGAFMNAVSFAQYYPKMMDSDKFNHVNPLLDTVPIMHDYPARVLLSETWCFISAICLAKQ